MSITEKINSWMIEKIAKDKVKYLYAVPKNILFIRIRELYATVDEIEEENHRLVDENYELRESLKKQETKKSLLEETEKLEKELQQMKEERKINKTELAYKALVKRCEELQQENKSIKQTLDVAHTAIQNTNNQNKILKEKNKRLESTNQHIEERYKYLKESSIEVINHNLRKFENNSSKANKTTITRQVNN